MICTIVDQKTEQPIRLQIDFHKEGRDVEVKGRRGNWKTRHLIDTHCILYDLSGTEKTILGESTAKQNPIDQYNKRVGKKIALEKLLRKFFSYTQKNEDGTETILWTGLFESKNNRRILWTNFRLTIGGWR